MIKRYTNRRILYIKKTCPRYDL